MSSVDSRLPGAPHGIPWLKPLIEDPHRPAPVGIFVKFPSIEALEILKLAGFDFVIFDAEHALLSVSDLNVQICVARGLGLAPMVRVADHGYGDSQRLLDAGAVGLFFPHVSSGEVAEQVVSQTTHPPRGTRGAGGGMRAGDWSLSARGTARYLDDSREGVLRVVMIEDKEGVDDVEGILATPDLGAIFIGHGDLSLSLGVPVGHQDEQDAARRVVAAARRHGVPVGTLAGSAAGCRRLREEGYDFVVAGSDVGLFAASAARLIDDLNADGEAPVTPVLPVTPRPRPSRTQR